MSPPAPSLSDRSGQALGAQGADPTEAPIEAGSPDDDVVADRECSEAHSVASSEAPVLATDAVDGDGADEVSSPEIGRVEQLLDEVHAALGRLDDGTYGTCLSCGAPIEDEQLVRAPAGSTCLACTPPPLGQHPLALEV